MRFAIIVVLFNPNENDIQNLRYLATLAERVYMVDNSPVILSVDSYPSNVAYLPQLCNRGLGVALNIGVRQALEDGFEWAITLDQDSRLTPKVIKEYEMFIENKITDGILCLAPRYQTDRNTLRNINEPYRYVATTMQSGAIFNTALWHRLGPFREDFFIDCIDYEYCYRARKEGFQILRCNQAVLVHNPAITCKTGFLRYGIAAPIRYYYQARNLYVCWKEYGYLQSFLLLVIKLAKIILLFPNKKSYLRSYWQGLNDGRKGVLGTLQRDV